MDAVLEIVSRRLAELAEPPVTTADMLALVLGVAREIEETTEARCVSGSTGRPEIASKDPDIREDTVRQARDILCDASSLGCPECAEYDRVHDQNCRLHPDYDPTPWCSACGARKKADCHCGPIADND